MARAKARVNGTISAVSFEGVPLDPTWPAVAIIAEPYDFDDDGEDFDPDFAFESELLD